MSKRSWIIASVLSFLVVVGGGGYAFWSNQNGHQSEVQKLRASAAATQAAAAKVQTDAAELAAKLTEARARIAQLEKEKDTVVQAHKSLEDEMRSALESKDVTISQLQGKLTVNILDRILFDSGEAELKPDGGEVLRKVAGILAQHPTLKVHVIGHTDNIPIRPSARNRFASNWELSTARATAAVRFLTERAGVDPSRLGAVGYGEFRPVAENTTAEGRARNRRIALTILSEEMAGSDAVPTVSTNAPAATTAATPPPAPTTPTATPAAAVPPGIPFPAVTNAGPETTPATNAAESTGASK